MTTMQSSLVSAMPSDQRATATALIERASSNLYGWRRFVFIPDEADLRHLHGTAPNGRQSRLIDHFSAGDSGEDDD